MPSSSDIEEGLGNRTSPKHCITLALLSGSGESASGGDGGTVQLGCSQLCFLKGFSLL